MHPVNMSGSTKKKKEGKEQINIVLNILKSWEMPFVEHQN